MRRRLTSRLLPLVAAASALLATPATAAAPTALSLNLCTDLLLVALAEPEQILGLSPFARDPVRSPVARAAATLPVLSGTAEEVLVGRPDIVLAGRFTRQATQSFLRARGVRVVEFDIVESVAAAERQIREAGALLGQPDRAERAVARIRDAVARARRAAAGTGPLRVLPLERRGWVTGRDTLTTSLLDLLGLGNVGGEVAGRYGRQVALERIVALRPDLLLVSGGGASPEDQGSALLVHPALARLYPPERRLVLPERFAAYCGGPSLADAIDWLAAEMERRR